uniref:Uncharacterized protein n=1 Tax=Streptomyces sp. NBC_00180 TaxID=2903632 RepID=A0AAU1I3G7_9ACTN
MKWLILGALLALLLLFPALGTALLGVVATVASQPLTVAFGLGLTAGLRVRSRGWTR